MSFFGSFKKLSLKKITATVKKTVSDATHIAGAYATGGISGGLSAVGSLSRTSSLTPSTIYGSPGAATAAATANQAGGGAGADGSSNMPLIIGGLVILALFMFARR